MTAMIFIDFLPVGALAGKWLRNLINVFILPETFTSFCELVQDEADVIKEKALQII